MAKLHSRVWHLLLVGLLFTPCLHVSGELTGPVYVCWRVWTCTVWRTASSVRVAWPMMTLAFGLSSFRGRTHHHLPAPSAGSSYQHGGSVPVVCVCAWQ